MAVSPSGAVGVAEDVNMAQTLFADVKLPAQAWGLAAWDAGGPIVTTAYDGADFGATAVCAFDLTGKLLWRQCFRGHPFPPRLIGDETAWVAHLGAQGAMVSELDSAGRIANIIGLESDPSEYMGDFVVLPDGLMVLWMPARRGRAFPAGRDARLARHDERGGTRWSTALPLREIIVPGAVTVTIKTGEERPAPPLRPRTLEVGYPDPLLVSGSRVAATLADGDSGIAVTFFVDTETGQLIGKTVPGPSHHKAIVGPGEFLIGFAGYGELSTARYDTTGAETTRWPTHAQMLVDTTGAISGPESENVLPSRSHFVRFDPEGAVQRGPALSAYYTTYPALDGNGTAVFWRDGALRAVDSDLNMRELVVTEQAEHAVTSRVLLLEDGHVVFALNDDLIVHREPGLGLLNDGVWPCADGGLRGNPVKFR